MYRCTQQHNFNHIPNTFYDFCIESNNSTICEIYNQYIKDDLKTVGEYIEWLLKNKYAVICTSIEEINSFSNMNFLYKHPSSISNALIEHNSSFDYCNMFDLLSSYGCRHVFIVSLDTMDVDEINSILTSTEYSAIRSIEVLCKNDKRTNINKLCNSVKNHSKLMRIVLHSSSHNKGYIVSPNNYYLVSVVKKKIEHIDNIFEISPETFSLTLKSYSESINHNLFYNKKIIIDRNSFIKLNLNYGKNFGKLSKEGVDDFLSSSEVRSIWELSKDKIEICKDCEYRYICLDYRIPSFLNDDSVKLSDTCSYNPYTSKWSSK